jgi:predicted nucleic acid-binding Zn ribbon protein
MERAGRALARLKLSRHGVEDEQLVRAAWPVAVGRSIARHTEALALVRSRVVVQVEDKIWQRQLWALRGQILARLNETLGRAIVEEIELRIAVPQRKPAVAETVPALLADEADAIRDPMFREIYKASRRRASA